MAPSPPAPSSGPRYAPHDPTLPKPWKGLVDGNTGYLYFWNPDTNVTQYERPDAGTLPGPPPLPKNFLLSSSVQVRPLPTARSSHEDDDDDRKGGRKRDTRSSARNKHDSRGGAITSSGYKSSVLHDHDSDAGHSSSKLSAESYRRQHEITVTGKDVPAPFMSFEATGFSSEILKEMRYLLQIGADVVRCGPPIGLLLFEVCTLLERNHRWKFFKKERAFQDTVCGQYFLS